MRSTSPGPEQDESVLGIPRSRFAPDLLEQTGSLDAAAGVAMECGADAVEPVHLLVTLARIPGGMTGRLFAEAGLSGEDLVEGLLAASPPTGARVLLRLDDGTAADRTRQLFAELHTELRAMETPAGPHGADGDPTEPSGAAVDQRRLLRAVLATLDAPTRHLLSFGRVDVDDWIARTYQTPGPRLACHGPDGALVRDSFGPGARRCLSTLASEAAALGRDRLTVVLLLHAMATVSQGVVEQASLFLRHDIRQIRTQLLAMTGGRAGGNDRVVAVDLSRATEDPALTDVLERSAELASLRAHLQVTEADLLSALVENPLGLAASFFRDAGVDTDRLLRYATELYQEPPEPEPDNRARPLSPEEAVALLRERVIGQEAVIEALRPRLELIIRARRRGFRIDDRAWGTFLFCGASGTGKTLMARTLAEAVFGSPDALVMFEMGHFNTRESINTFIGAPPGYVGFGEGKLTNALRDDPARVLLFDEVEKADSRVFDALLRLLDEGRINDPAGPVRDARESLIVLTSNLAVETDGGTAGQDGVPDGPPLKPPPEPSPAAPVPGLPFEPGRRVGAGSVPAGQPGAGMRSELATFFRPEFLNRVDVTVRFASFTRAALHDIASSVLRAQARRARDGLGVELVWDGPVARLIAEQAIRLRPQEAARGVNRCVADLVPGLLCLLDEQGACGRSVRQVRLTAVGENLSWAEVGDG